MKVKLFYDSEIRMRELVFFFFKQKTAYEIVDCDWSSDVCSSDLRLPGLSPGRSRPHQRLVEIAAQILNQSRVQAYQKISMMAIGRARRGFGDSVFS